MDSQEPLLILTCFSRPTVEWMGFGQQLVIDANSLSFACSVERMRLTSQEVNNIKNAARRVFGSTVEVRLFGSRVNDNARGGDIDLYLLVDPEQYTLQRELRFELELLKKFGERRIDVLVRKRGDVRLPIDGGGSG